MKYHRQNPDDAVAATARFKEVSEAYETLTKESDPEDMFSGVCHLTHQCLLRCFVPEYTS
jgi:hypothetical protein